ncbi:hypothetical protein HPB47_012162 [Ixodes persulcatus]|uniref:Uncharacterized protein n=1 Tax=Ixodes persulcatus TaxID=34615 RepID=A0AC60NUA9_IXOPE|nr:hypothetical protein HPB47_012162 [Ixodes persulcatus]
MSYECSVPGCLGVKHPGWFSYEVNQRASRVTAIVRNDSHVAVPSKVCPLHSGQSFVIAKTFYHDAKTGMAVEAPVLSPPPPELPSSSQADSKVYEVYSPDLTEARSSVRELSVSMMDLFEPCLVNILGSFGGDGLTLGARMERIRRQDRAVREREAARRRERYRAKNGNAGATEPFLECVRENVFGASCSVCDRFTQDLVSLPAACHEVLQSSYPDNDVSSRKKRAAEALGDGNGMTLSALRRDGDCGGDSEGANGEGPSSVKRAHLDEKEQFVVCDCDIMATVNKVIGGFNLEQAWKEEMDKFSRRLGLLDDLEREFIEIDIAFDKMERDLTKLKEKKSVKKRRNFDFATKLKAIQRVEAGEKSLTVADDIGIPRSTLSTLFKNKAAEQRTSGACRVRAAAHGKVEKALYAWFLEVRAKNIPVDGPMLMAKAKWFAAALEWLQAWDVELGKSGRRACLLVDNCSAHHTTCELKNIELNRSTRASSSLSRWATGGDSLISCWSTSAWAPELKVDLLGAIQMLTGAWRDVKTDTVANCFRKAGFVTCLPRNLRKPVKTVAKSA